MDVHQGFGRAGSGASAHALSSPRPSCNAGKLLGMLSGAAYRACRSHAKARRAFDYLRVVRRTYSLRSGPNFSRALIPQSPWRPRNGFHISQRPCASRYWIFQASKTFQMRWKRLQNFIDKLGPSLEAAWCTNRDAYMLYGDASPYLGTASKKMYCLVRKTLGVPFLCLARILTPEPEQFVGQQASATATGVRNAEAPTVGSYIAVDIQRASPRTSQTRTS